MPRQRWLSLLTFLLAAALPALARAAEAEAETGGKDVEARMQRLEEELARLRESVRRQAASTAAASTPAPSRGWIGRALGSFNPGISVVIDAFYHHDNTKNGIEDVYNNMAGFGHSHAGGEEHHHGETADGFNLHHVEFFFSGDVDPYFRAWANAAVDADGAELEEAVIQTSCLPGGLQAQVGKFFSGFGRINAQHAHQWDFVDAPLIHRLLFGEHGLNDKGAQVSWLAPTPFYLLGAFEGFQGENERMFNHIGGDPFRKKRGPRAAVGWFKVGPDLPGRHALQFGGFGGYGTHEEEHDGNSDGTSDHWLQGPSVFWGGDAVYKYDSPRPYGQGDFIAQAEYMRRRQNLRVLQHDLNASMVGRHRVVEQDGFYAQAAYGFLPRWRAGLRWDMVGDNNLTKLPDGSRERFDPSYRGAAMVDFSPTEFSRLRLQASRGVYQLAGARKDAWEIFLQLTISLGTHGAHKF